MEKVFVYGSLREGEYNFGRLGPQKVLGVFVTGPNFKLISLGTYPAMVYDPSHVGDVTGEVHEITEEQLRRFDSMENGAGYKRAEVPVSQDGMEFRGVWAYIMDDAPWMRGHLVPSGDWKGRA